MIRINLLGQIRPKASRRPVDTGAALPIVFVGAGLVLGGLVLGYIYLSWQKQLSTENDKIKALKAQKTELTGIKAQVEEFDRHSADACRYDREIAEGSYRRAGIAGHGGKHGVPYGKPLADGFVAQGQYAEYSGRERFNQFSGELYYGDEAFWILSKS